MRLVVWSCMRFAPACVEWWATTGLSSASGSCTHIGAAARRHSAVHGMLQIPGPAVCCIYVKRTHPLRGLMHRGLNPLWPSLILLLHRGWYGLCTSSGLSDLCTSGLSGLSPACCASVEGRRCPPLSPDLDPNGSQRARPVMAEWCPANLGTVWSKLVDRVFPTDIVITNFAVVSAVRRHRLGRWACAAAPALLSSQPPGAACACGCRCALYNCATSTCGSPAAHCMFTRPPCCYACCWFAGSAASFACICWWCL